MVNPYIREHKCWKLIITTSVNTRLSHMCVCIF